MHELGFIGCGNMARAIIKGILGAQLVEPQDIIASARTRGTLMAAKTAFGINATESNVEAAQARVVVLAVKPQVLDGVLAEIADHIPQDALVVSIAAGKTLEWLGQRLPGKRLVRLMPNTPAMVGQGMTSVVFGEGCTPEDEELVMGLVSSFGRAEIIPERLIDAGSAAAGCAPAFMYMFIEALADAAVLEGMPRAQAYRYVAQTMVGAGTMVLEGSEHPAQLKDAVCSPGGTTIEGVRKLEERGFRSAIIEAAVATCEKSRSM